MRVGDLVEVLGYDSSGDDEHSRQVGVLMGWDNSDEGWIVLVTGQLQVYPRVFWRCRRV